MKIYLDIEDKRIVDISEDKIKETSIEIEFRNIDEFYESLKGKNINSNLDEEVGEKLKELLELDEENIRKVSLNSYDIRHWVSNRSFGELIDMFDNGEILKPSMQREFVWDSLKCSRLIESIIIGLPIPPLFLLEVKKNEYEIIDGFQRLTTLSNFVNGRPWYEKPKAGKSSPARLSKKVSMEIAGKSFKDLNPEYQKVLRRNTIPLIEFSQIIPEDTTSKYLIFERINTGSEKLNPMQIRKALSNGIFMRGLYEPQNMPNILRGLFTINALKKDSHIEALLRIIVMNDVYLGNYTPEVFGIKNILNDYCEKNRNKFILEALLIKINEAFETCKKIFKLEKNMFKRVEKGEEYIYSGSLNISILDSFLVVLLNSKKVDFDVNEIEERYKQEMNLILSQSLRGEGINPFTTSTGTIDSINKRFRICEKILGIDF